MLGQRWRLCTKLTIGPIKYCFCWDDRSVFSQLRRHLADISPAPSEQVVYNWYLYKAVETPCGLRYIKTAIAHTTQYQCCVNIKKHDRDNATSYLQRPHNAGPMSTTLGQKLTCKYVGLTHDITVVFKQR